MSVSIATMGLFNPPGGGGVVYTGTGGVIRVPEDKKKPTINIKKITSSDEGSKKKIIEVISIIEENNYGNQ